MTPICQAYLNNALEFEPYIVNITLTRFESVYVDNFFIPNWNSVGY